MTYDPCSCTCKERHESMQPFQMLNLARMEEILGTLRLSIAR
jgi:hypothetical protein